MLLLKGFLKDTQDACFKLQAKSLFEREVEDRRESGLR